MTLVVSQPAAARPMQSPRSLRRVLLVSYHFPPVGGAGVQRPLKFVKYLGRHGWQASVLAASNPSVPVFDESLCADIPPDAVIARARTWEPGYVVKRNGAEETHGRISRFGNGLRTHLRDLVRHAAGLVLQPDAQILWTPSAYMAGKRLLSRLPYDAIFATAPAYSNLVLGMLLKRRFGLPLILDFRDEWDLSSRYFENSARGRPSHSVQRRMQRAVLRAADAVVATTQASAERLRQKARLAGSHAHVTCIYNGYDEDDFTRLADTHVRIPARKDRFRLVYTGTLWNLTSIQPLVNALGELRSRAADVLERFELVVVGRQTPEQLALLNRLADLDCRLIVQEYRDHDTALEWMASADALCLLLSDVEGANRVVPAKLFEYLATRREILAILPDGEAADIVGRYWPNRHFLPSDVSGIASWIFRKISEPRLAEAGAPDAESIQMFRRERQAGQLASVFDDVLASPVGGSGRMERSHDVS